MRQVIVDTSVFMEGNNELLESLVTHCKVIVPVVVLDELDNLKDDSRNNQKSQKARVGIKFIENNYDEIDFRETDNEFKKHDDAIVNLAQTMASELITFDIGMKVRAMQRGVDVITEINGEDINSTVEMYKGYKILVVDPQSDEDQEILSKVYNNENILDMHINEYIIIRYSDGNTIDIKRWDGNSFVKLKSSVNTSIRPANDLQKCAIDILLNKDIAVKGVFGAAGCGKTYLAVKAGLHQLKLTEDYERILCVRNPVGPGEDIGFLKGDKEDKVEDYFKPVIQHLDNGKVEATDMVFKDKLAYEIPRFMKGLDIQDTYIFVDEAEDLDCKIMKLLGTRISRNSCIVFAGDISQAESKYKNNNGIKELIKRSKGNPVFGYIVLEEDLRSDASKMFAELF